MEFLEVVFFMTIIEKVSIIKVIIWKILFLKYGYTICNLAIFMREHMEMIKILLCVMVWDKLGKTGTLTIRGSQSASHAW